MGKEQVRKGRDDEGKRVGREIRRQGSQEEKEGRAKGREEEGGKKEVHGPCPKENKSMALFSLAWSSRETQGEARQHGETQELRYYYFCFQNSMNFPLFFIFFSISGY